MVRRYWWALVVLTAVLAMHGLQCTSDGSHALTGHDSGSTASALPFASGPVQLTSSPGEPAPRTAPDHAGHPAGAAALGDASSPLLADFWTVCFAVLSGALALLAAVLLRPRSRTRARSPGPFAPTWSSATAPRRPPDLFALCVLRN